MSNQRQQFDEVYSACEDLASEMEGEIVEIQDVIPSARTYYCWFGMKEGVKVDFPSEGDIERVIATNSEDAKLQLLIKYPLRFLDQPRASSIEPLIFKSAIKEDKKKRKEQALVKPTPERVIESPKPKYTKTSINAFYFDGFREFPGYKITENFGCYKSDDTWHAVHLFTGLKLWTAHSRLDAAAYCILMQSEFDTKKLQPGYLSTFLVQRLQDLHTKWIAGLVIVKFTK
jgi:hypothetical protein